jgi:hypothetical protein
MNRERRELSAAASRAATGGRLRLALALLFLAAAAVIPGWRAEAAQTHSGEQAQQPAIQAQEDIPSGKELYRMYSSLIGKKKLRYFHKSGNTPVDVYVHDVNDDGIPEVIVGYYVFTIYNGKAVNAGCGAAMKGAFCHWFFGEGEDQMGVMNSIDYVASFQLKDGKLVKTSSCTYGVSKEAEAQWNAYGEQFKKKFPEQGTCRSCKNMKSVLRYIKKKLG